MAVEFHAPTTLFYHTAVAPHVASLRKLYESYGGRVVTATVGATDVAAGLYLMVDKSNLTDKGNFDLSHINGLYTRTSGSTLTRYMADVENNVMTWNHSSGHPSDSTGGSTTAVMLYGPLTQDGNGDPTFAGQETLRIKKANWGHQMRRMNLLAAGA